MQSIQKKSKEKRKIRIHCVGVVTKKRKTNYRSTICLDLGENKRKEKLTISHDHYHYHHR